MKMIRIHIILAIALLSNAIATHAMTTQANRWRQMRKIKLQKPIQQPTPMPQSTPKQQPTPIQKPTWGEWAKSLFSTKKIEPVKINEPIGGYATEEGYSSPFGPGGQKRMYSASKEQQGVSWRNFVESRKPSAMSYIPFTQEHNKEVVLDQYKALLDDIEKYIETEIRLQKYFHELSKEDKYEIYREGDRLEDKIKNFDFSIMMDYREEVLIYYAAILKSWDLAIKNAETEGVRIFKSIQWLLVDLVGKILETFKQFNIDFLEIDRIKEKHFSLFKDIKEIFEDNEKYAYKRQQQREESRLKRQQEYYEKESREGQQKKKQRAQEEIERQKREEQRKQQEKQEQAERQKEQEEQEQRWEQRKKEGNQKWEQEFKSHFEEGFGKGDKFTVAKNKLAQLLGIPAGVSEKEIGDAYRKFVREYHPDITKDPNNSMSLKLKNEINPAWDEYNEALKAAKQETMNRE